MVLCGENYTELQSHLDTAGHKYAAIDNVRYAGVDTLIKRGVSWKDVVKNVEDKRPGRLRDNQ